MIGLAYSACSNCVGLAVAHFSGKKCVIRNVSEDPGENGRPRYTCSCGAKAAWFFRELHSYELAPEKPGRREVD